MHTFHEEEDEKNHSNCVYINVTLSQFIFFIFLYFFASNSLNLNYLFNLQNWNVICDNDAFFKDHLFAMLKRKDEEKKIQPWKFGRGVNHQPTLYIRSDIFILNFVWSETLHQCYIEFCARISNNSIGIVYLSMQDFRYILYHVI